MIYDTRLRYKAILGVGGVHGVLTGAEEALGAQKRHLRWILSTAVGGAGYTAPTEQLQG